MRLPNMTAICEGHGGHAGTAERVVDPIEGTLKYLCTGCLEERRREAEG